MLNSMQLADIERMGAGVIIIRDTIRKTLRGTLCNGVLLYNDMSMDVRVIYYWLGGGKILHVVGSDKDEALKQAHALENIFEDAFLENRNGIRAAYFRRISLKLMCIGTSLVSLAQIIIQIETKLFYESSDSFIIKVCIYFVIMIISTFISMKANAF